MPSWNIFSAIFSSCLDIRIEPQDKKLVLRNAFSQSLLFPAPLDKGNVDSGNEIDLQVV